MDTAVVSTIFETVEHRHVLVDPTTVMRALTGPADTFASEAFVTLRTPTVLDAMDQDVMDITSSPSWDIIGCAPDQILYTEASVKRRRKPKRRKRINPNKQCLTLHKD